MISDMHSGVEYEGLAIVTGGTSGFGHGLTALLLEKKFEVVITSRRLDRAKEIVDSFKLKTGSVVPMQLDLADLHSVVNFAKEFEEIYKGRKLTYLFLNAGIVKLERSITPHGFEETYATNHFGGVALFNLLFKNTLVPSLTRVIAVGSIVHTNASITLNELTSIVKHDISGASTPFSPVVMYSNSKLFNTLWAYQVQKRYYTQYGITCNSLHPGSGLFTNLGRGDASTCLRCLITPILILITPFAWLIGFFQTWRQGGIAELAAAEVKDGGIYLFRDKPSVSSKTSLDLDTQEWLWKETERLLHEAAMKHGLPMSIAGPNFEDL